MKIFGVLCQLYGSATVAWRLPEKEEFNARLDVGKIRKNSGYLPADAQRFGNKMIDFKDFLNTLVHDQHNRMSCPDIRQAAFYITVKHRQPLLDATVIWLRRRSQFPAR